MIKKALFIVMIISLLMSSITMAATSFTDTTGSEWYYDDLMYLAGESVIDGKSDGSFSGNELLNKDALIKTLVVSKGYSVGNASGYWAQNYINQANSLNWFLGAETGKYTEPINRYESCLLIVNALGANITYPDNLNDYSIYISDFDSIPSKYIDVVLKVYALGIITGYSDSTFKGNNTLTRAEMVAIISRFKNPSNRKTPLNPVELATIEGFKDNKSIVNDYTVVFVDNKLKYYDAQSDSWKAIESTTLNPEIARIAENTYINLAVYNNGNTDYAVTPSYDYGTYYINITKPSTTITDLVLGDLTIPGDLLYAITIQNNSRQIILELADLNLDPFNELSTQVAYNHLEVLKSIAPDQYNNIYDFIKEHYEVNNSSDLSMYIDYFDKYTVQIITRNTEYRVFITIN